MVRFGKWTATGETVAKGRRVYLRCVCECGTEKLVRRDALRHGESVSCGCAADKFTSARFRKMPAIGTKNHRLLVLSYAGKDKRNNILIDVRCDCGSEKVVKATAFRSGAVKSCGCYRREMQNNAVVKYHEPGEAGLASLMSRLKQSAKSRGYDFSLNKEEVRQITKQNCFYCGVVPSQISRSNGNTNLKRKEYATYIYNGLDRMNNDLGYVLGNVVACCDYCNIAKNDQSYDEFVARLEAILARHGRRVVS